MPLSAFYESTYDQLLSLLYVRCDSLPEKVCLHWPMHQPSFSGKLLIIGQAPNDWPVRAQPRDLGGADLRKELLAQTRKISEAPDAFDWMERRERTRPFWKLVDVALTGLGLTLGQIAWSNLAKVAPNKGNPTGGLLQAQHELGGCLLRKEVEELNPELVLVVSGRIYAEPFLTSAGYRLRWSRRGALQFDGLLDGRRWIVVSHPGTYAYRYEASQLALKGALGL